MANKFELNQDAVNASISSIVGAINGLNGIDIKLDGDINTTTAFTEYKTKVGNVKTVLGTEFPRQLENAMAGIASKVEALKEMEQKLKEMIQKQSSQNSGQGGDKGFR